MSTYEIDCVVIGAGIIGLAVARALALSGKDVWVLEAEKTIGTGISSRNSEVIHAGIYHPEGSLKAQLCVRGKSLLYEYLDERTLPYKRCGKLIAACNDAQQASLENILAKADANGVNDLQPLSRAQAQELEPALNCVGALLSPSTGIVDTHSLMLSLQGDLENAGGQIVFSATVQSGVITSDGIELQVQNKDEAFKIKAKNVVNAGGLSAVPVAKNIEGFPVEKIPPCFYAKGHYFSLNAYNPFQRLIYPVPEKDGLGVHLTIDLGGKARFGPDVEWIEEIDYNVPQSLDEKFYPLIREYWPELPDGSLSADYSGIRPKIHAPDQPAADFMIQTPDEHGIEGMVHLFGIESPGITASLAIAEYVTNTL